VTMRAAAGTVLRLAFSGLLLALVLARTDLDAAALRIASADVRLLAAAFAATAAQILALAWRWSAAMAGIGAPLGFRCALAVTLGSLFVGQVLPTSIGSDAWRVWRVRLLGHPVSAGVHGVLVDRAAALGGLVLVVGATMPALFLRVADPGWQTALAAGLAAALASLALAVSADRLARAWPSRPWLEAAGRFARTLRRLALQPRRALPLVAVSALAHLGAGATAWLIAQALTLPASLADCIVLMPPVMLLAALPVSLAGWGVREGAMVALFAAAGLPADGALPLSLLFGLLLLAASLPGAAVILLRADLPRAPDRAGRGGTRQRT
jgi:uncharacterized membrane protein YbhN (UPF0104 family)